MNLANPGFFDTHIHLDEFLPRQRLDNEISLAREAGIRHFLVPGVRRDNWSAILAAAKAVEGAWAAPGIHPLAADTWNETTEKALLDILSSPKIVAVGEIGLDNSPDYPPPEIQEVAFRSQLRIAAQYGLPVLIHCRQAWRRILDIIREEKADLRGGILHAFSASREIAKEATALNFAIGIGGTVTYPNARRILEVLDEIPQDYIVLETDAPDMSPHPFRGESNRPLRLKLIAEKVAEKRGWSMHQTMTITTSNAFRVLKLSPPEVQRMQPET
jgi:TatD DNase family protein